jgi:hypothetical protein
LIIVGKNGLLLKVGVQTLTNGLVVVVVVVVVGVVGVVEEVIDCLTVDMLIY